MMRTKLAASAVAALVILGGCSSDNGGSPSPAETDPAVTSAPPSVAPSTAAPSGIVPPAGSPSPAPSAALTLVESCRAVADEQQDGLAAVRTYAANPLDGEVDVQDLDRLRSELKAVRSSAPEALRDALGDQVGVLDTLVQGIQDRKVPKVDVSAYREAAGRIRDLCADAGQ